LSLYLTKHHVMQMYGRVELHTFLTLALDGGHFAPGKRVPSTHYIGCWVDPRASLDTVVKRTIPCPCWNQTPAVQPVA